MKLKRWSQNLLAISAAIGSGVGLVSCGESNTIDYLYATSSKNNPGQINVYRVDSESGALTQISDSPYNADRNPVYLVIDSSGKYMYVANHDDNTIQQLNIGSDAKLYPQHTINPSGSEPISLAIHTYTNGSTTTTFLFVVETYQPNYTDADPGPGALYVYNLGSAGTIPSAPVTQTASGTGSDYVALGTAPTAVNVTADGNRVFASDILATGQTGTGTGSQTCTTGQGAIQSYNMTFDSSGNATGVLAPVTGSPFCAGITPSALASHPYSTFLYVTDSTQNEVISYNIATANTSSIAAGALTPLQSGPVATGTTPDGIVVDPRGEYVYVSNKIGGSVTGYGVNLGTGALSALATGGSAGTDAQPGCIIVDPALGRYVYTANFAGNDISGFVLNPDNGSLSAVENTPFVTSGLSNCVAATPHNNHTTIQVQNSAG